MTENEKEVKIIQKHFMDLAQKCYQQNIYTFSNFLALPDQSVLMDMKRELNFVALTLDGGNEQCERVVARFGSEAQLGYDVEFPIKLIKVEPLQQKFADALGHRDFLGAIMNLGIERDTIGDIFIKDNVGYVFALDSIADYVLESLDKIRHTSVRCSVLDNIEGLALQEKKQVAVTVSSERIDGIISKLYNLSRTQSLELFRTGKVFLNGRLCENNSCSLKKDDVITVRGFGKFFYEGLQRETKKGKLAVNVWVYI